MTADPAAARVLLAGAEPMVARILAHKLRREGHDVACVSDAAALRAALEAQDADVLIAEPALLQDAAAALRSPQLRVRCGWLALVEARDATAGVRAVRAGAAGLVRMPFKPTDVASQVATLLALPTGAA